MDWRSSPECTALMPPMDDFSNSLLDNPRLLRSPLQHLPARRDAWQDGATMLAVQHGLARRITGTDTGKGLGNLLHQRGRHIAMHREAAMTIAWTGPENAQAAWGKGALPLHGVKGALRHRPGIIFPLTDALHHVLFVRTGAARTLVVERTCSQIGTGIEPHLLQEVIR